MGKLHTSLRRRLLIAFALLVVSGILVFSNTFASWASRSTSVKAVPGSSAQATAAQDPPPEQLSLAVKSQIAALQAEKQLRTSAQKKLDSQLLYAIKMNRNEAIAQGVPTLEVDVPIDDQGRIEVDLTANVDNSLIQKIQSEGGLVISSFPEYHSIRAKIPAQKIEGIASLPEVINIRPKDDYLTQRIERTTQPGDGVKIEAMAQAQLDPGFAPRATRVQTALRAALQDQSKKVIPPSVRNVGSKNSEGDTTHRAVNARNTYGVGGSGLKIGVLSNGVGGLAQAQASGDLGTVTILPGQEGTGAEGTAMLEIVHDLVPNAQLYFSTANGGTAVFANNIRALRTAGCDIIIDDVFYFIESPFQDGQAPTITSQYNSAIIAQAVADVTADGALYFSSAGNGGNKVDNTSGVWEGDFVDGGPAASPIGAANGNVHNFGGSLFDTISVSSNRVYLFWSDPLGASDNDYDLYLLNSTGTTILGASTGVQDGTSPQDPVEGLSGTIANNSRVVVVKFAGADRFLHVDLLPNGAGRFAISTNGQTKGHSSVAGAFAVAAAPANVAFGAPPNPVGPFPNPFTAANKCELFSADGPRKLFYNADSTPITPGNVSSTGGTSRAKPDITAADGVVVTGVGGFGSPFFGTSAAAPHAGAIAALVKSANPSLTPAQIRTILTTTAIDNEAAGYDNLAGFGILDALAAVQAVNPTPQALLTLGTVTATEGTVNNGDGQVEPGETANLTIQLQNPSAVAATNVQGTLSLFSPTPGVTILSGSANYGNIAAGANATNATPYVIAISRTVPCGTVINLQLTVTFGGGVSPATFNFSITAGMRQAPITTTLDTTAPPAGTYTASTGAQTGRLNRFSPASDCSSLKANPGLFATTGARQFDAYTFTNNSATTQCVTVTTSSSGTQLYTAAYNSSGFVPSNPSTNFLADPGASSASTSFAFNVAPGAQFTVVVSEVNPAGGLGSVYTLDVALFSCAAPPACPTISINPASIPAATMNAAYSQTFTASGGVGPYALALTGTLPSGVTFDPMTGVLSGTPTQAGIFPFTISATDALGCTGSRNYTLAVNALTSGLSDPAVCTGPGGVVAVNFNVANPSGVPQNVVATATLPAQLLALPGTCTTNVGTCTVVNASTVMLTATLAAGQTATVNYLSQIADGTPTNTQLCITTAASFGGAAPITVLACTTVNCPPVGPGAPLNAASPISDQKAGSVLFYNVYTSGTSPNQQDTRVSITNTNLTRSAFVHFFFVDGSSCSIADSFVCLTANQTASFLASDLDPGTTGYIVAIAVGSDGCPVNFNYLIGDEYVKFQTGHAANLGAEAITAIAGGLPLCNQNSSTALLAFDGVSYNVVPRTLALDNIPSRADGNDTLLILNRIGGNLGTGASTLGTIFGLFYDDAESSISFSLTGGCQLRGSITNNFPRTTPRFEQYVPAGRSGWMKFFSQSDVGITGAAINFNANAGAAAGAFNQGHNLHVLTTSAGMVYTIPVFPPSC